MRRPMGSAVGVSALRNAQSGASQPPALSAAPPTSEPAPRVVPPQPPPAPRGGWCKHACCLAYLVAERLTTDPFLIFTLRGLPREDLIERLRQRRAYSGSGQGSVAVYAPLVAGVSDAEPTPLEECVDHFWEAGPELDAVDLAVTRPDVSHPLLRRLGPSPFGAGSGKFPLVGLLATCYEVISEATMKEEEADAPDADAISAETPVADEPKPESDPNTDDSDGDGSV